MRFASKMPMAQKVSKPVTSSVPAPTKNMSVRVSRIENGYLVHHSGMKGKKYVEKTYHSASNPIQIKAKGKK